MKTPRQVADAMQSYGTIDYRHHPVDESDRFIWRVVVLLKNGETWTEEVVIPLTEFDDDYFSQHQDIIEADLWDRSVAKERIKEGETSFSDRIVIANSLAPIIRTPQNIIDTERTKLESLILKDPVIYNP